MEQRKSRNGSGWVTKEVRVALYIRSNWTCAYCGKNLYRNGPTLDHLTPYCEWGDNGPANLVCCCHECNNRRGSMGLEAWINQVAAETGQRVQDIARRIMTTVRKPLDLGAAIAEIESYNAAKQ